VRARVPVWGVRLFRERTLAYGCEGESAEHSVAVKALLHKLIGANDRETLAVVFLDAKLVVTGCHVAAIGGQSAMGVAMREVFRAAVLAGAAAIVVGHNHPSGDPEPSADDVATTEKIVAAGELLGIRVVDHVVVSRDGRSVSLHERGKI
jgi:DNA repair protein RadC